MENTVNVYQASIRIHGIIEKVNAAYKGKKFKVISNYNGQPYGRSKKSMKGEILTVELIGFDNEKAYIFPEGQRLSIGINEVEFME
jgi:hypothetical protein